MPLEQPSRTGASASRRTQALFDAKDLRIRELEARVAELEARAALPSAARSATEHALRTSEAHLQLLSHVASELLAGAGAKELFRSGSAR